MKTTGQTIRNPNAVTMDTVVEVWVSSPRHNTEDLKKVRLLTDRSVKDPNEFIVKGDIVEVVLYNKDCIEVARAISNAIHYELLAKYKWCLTPTGYSCTNINGKSVFMHRYLSSNCEGMDVDHINHDTLDNRDENLRVCTRQQNIWNTRTTNRNTSGFTGVSWSTEKKRWRASITIRKKKITLGDYKDINDAIAARKEANIKYFGNFAYKSS